MMQEFLLVRSVVCVAYMFSHIFSSSVLGFFLFLFGFSLWFLLALRPAQ